MGRDEFSYCTTNKILHDPMHGQATSGSPNFGFPRILELENQLEGCRSSSYEMKSRLVFLLSYIIKKVPCIRHDIHHTDTNKNNCRVKSLLYLHISSATTFRIAQLLSNHHEMPSNETRKTNRDCMLISVTKRQVQPVLKN